MGSNQSTNGSRFAEVASLVNVRGTDAVISETVSVSPRGVRGSSKTEEIDGRKVEFVDEALSSQATWNDRGDRTLTLFMPLNSPLFRSVTETAVRHVASLSNIATGPTSFSSEAITEVVRWDGREPTTLLTLKPRAGVRPENIENIENMIFSQRVNTSAALAQRMFTASGLRIKPYRFGNYLVSAPPQFRNVRSLRMSEFRRLVRLLDRDRAAEIAGPRWERLNSKLEYGTVETAASRYACVRTSIAAACDPFLINRLLGSQWVYTTVGVTEVRANGVPQKSFAAKGMNPGRVFVFPPSVRTITLTYAVNGRDITERVVSRPSY